MADTSLFQLGIGLATGAQAEDKSRNPLVVTEIEHAETAEQRPELRVVAGRDVMDETRDDHFIRRGGKVYAGTHLIIEVMGGTGLDEEARIQQAFRDCVEECGATLLHIHTHKFSPQGVSGVAVLSESHISVHTWPEIGYGAFDVFMCGDAQPWRAVGVLSRAFETEDIRVQELLRGDGLVEQAL